MDTVEQRIDVRHVTGPRQALVERVAPAVCQIVLCQAPGEERAIGTGALVRTGAGIAILTAGHVTEIGNTGSLKAVFNYERDLSGRIVETMQWHLAVAEEWVDGLDYALAVACDEHGHPPPQNVFRPLEIGQSSTLNPGEGLVCIHHPNGEPKQYSPGTFVALADCQVRYHVFTDARSSGAPVLNLRGEVVAVHRAELAPGRPCAKIGTSIDAIGRTSPGLARRRRPQREAVTPNSSNAAQPRNEILRSRL